MKSFPATSYLTVDFFQEFTLTDDCVLQEHHEDPRLVHMTLLGENSEFDQKIADEVVDC